MPITIPIPRPRAGQLNGMPFVEQLHYSGCAIACIATIAGRTYDEAQRTAQRERSRDKSLWDHEIVETLASFGIRGRFVEGHVLDDRPAILMFDWPESVLTHCVVWDPIAVRFIDPSIGSREQLFEWEFWVSSGRHAVVVEREAITARPLRRPR